MTDTHTPPHLKSFPPAKKTTKALDRSRIDLLHASNLNRRAHGILWGQADKCPLFMQKRKQPVDGNGNLLPYPRNFITKKEIKTRSNRALSAHTLKTMASGAAATIGAQLASDCAMLRTRDPRKPPEDPKYPMLPSFTSGAAYAVEAAYIAYMQELFDTAITVKNTVGKHKKVTAKCCQVGAEMVNAKISAATGFVPPSIAPRKIIAKTKKGNASGARVRNNGTKSQVPTASEEVESSDVPAEA